MDFIIKNKKFFKPNLSLNIYKKQKRFYTRGTLRSIRISQDTWIKKRSYYLSCIKGRWVLKEIHCIAQNAALFVDLL